MNVIVDDMRGSDWKAVCLLYAQGLATGLAAFMNDPPDQADWDSGHLDIGRLVARDGDGSILGWAALAPVPDT